ncbi:MAG: DUF433 domain-containing protein [Armatimonadetes bacterium]|nr:DUF433 domain-containing protein [Anaerolineae bacterium]
MAVVIPINHIEIRDGRPVIAGKNLKVAYIAKLYLKGDTPMAWIVENYDITPSQVHAAVSYYYDHQAELDAYIHEGDAWAQAVGLTYEQVIARIEARQATEGDLHQP